MTSVHVEAIDRSPEKAHVWLNELTAELGDDDRQGAYYEGWDPSSTPQRYREPTEFLDRVAHEALLHGDTEASFAVSAAAAVLRKHISAGELDDVLHVLPAPIGALLTEPPT